MLSPLRHRPFAFLFAAHVVGLVGNGVSTVALALLAYELAGGNAGLVLGTALTLKMVAYVMAGPFGGVIAARFARRPLLACLGVARALLLLSLVFAGAVWHIYVLVFLISIGAAVFTPVFQATIPEILPNERTYTRALSLSRLAYDLENLASPLTAALLLGFISFDGLFAVAGVAFLLSALLVVRAGPLPSVLSNEAGLAVIQRGMMRYLGLPSLRALLALSVAVAAAGAMVIVNTVVYVRDILGGAEADVAVAMAAFGAGSMVAALCLPSVFDRVTDRPVLLTGGFILAAGLLAGTAAPNFVVLLVLWCVLGAASSLVQTPAGRLLARAAGPGEQPRLFSAHFVMTHACWMLCYPLAGWTAQSGFAFSFAVLASLSALAFGAAFLAWRGDEQQIAKSV